MMKHQQHNDNSFNNTVQYIYYTFDAQLGEQYDLTE